MATLKMHSMHPLIPRRALCAGGGMKHGPVHGTTDSKLVTCTKCIAKLAALAAYKAAKAAKLAPTFLGEDI
jgi:hypothetical protein